MFFMKITTIKYVRNKCNTFFWTIYNKIRLRYFWKIEIGKDSSFNGILCIWKNSKSQITIGNGCMFISNANTRNLVGINRKCILNTQRPGSKIIIGNNTGLSGTVISSAISVEIGNNVKCGANTQIMDSDWHPEDPRSGTPKSIIIHNNVWLGLNVVVLKGVTIGENTVIGANSVVTKSIPANVLAAGNPCKVIKPLNIENR